MVPTGVFDALFESLIEPIRAGSLSLTISDATSPTFPLVYANAAFCALTGYAEADVVGRNCRFLQGPMSDPIQSGVLRTAISNGLSARAIIWNYRRDGSPFLNEVIINPVRDAAGVLRYFTGIQRDVTAVDGRPSQHVRFALLPDASLRALGHPKGPGTEWLEALSPRERRRLANAAAVVAASGDELRRLLVKIEVTKPDGSARFEKLDAARVPAPPGASSGVASANSTFEEGVVFEGVLAVTAQDTTLQGRLRLLEAVVSSANDAIVITEAEPLDHPGPRILYVNESAERQTGYRADQMLGRSPRMLQGPDTDRNATARLGRSLRQWAPSSAKLLNYRADGSTFNIDLSITPVADEYGWWTHWISIQRDETERRTAADRVAYQAMHDSLTGLGNRRLLTNAFDEIVTGTLTKGASTAYGILQVDLDRFKSINDTFGHAAGDAVLVETARRLRDCSRSSDVISRIGGDEFLLMLPGIDSEPALESAAERVRHAVTGRFLWNDVELPIRASVGAALYPTDGETLEALMVAADVSLYRAKQEGRGRISVFTPLLREEVRTSRELGVAIRLALERGEFEPFFQPQVKIADSSLVGLEALVRWRHPTRGLIAPGLFLGAAAEAGLMAELDEFVLGRVLETAARWTRAGLFFGRIGVNLSSETFANPRLVDMLQQRIAYHDLSPHQIGIEMVESVFIGEDPKGVTDKLSALRRLGISVDLDDFGTGYAALTHLRTFQIDRIKLDRSFIKEIGRDKDNDVIVSAIVRLAQNLGLHCVAEGVETIEQLELLRRLGCDQAQGYFFAKPMPEDMATRWLQTEARLDKTDARNAKA